MANILAKSEEDVIKDLKAMTKGKLLFGTLDEDTLQYTLDEDFDLKLFASQMGCAEGIM